MTLISHWPCFGMKGYYSLQAQKLMWQRWELRPRLTSSFCACSWIYLHQYVLDHCPLKKPSTKILIFTSIILSPTHKKRYQRNKWRKRMTWGTSHSYSQEGKWQEGGGETKAGATQLLSASLSPSGPSLPHWSAHSSIVSRSRVGGLAATLGYSTHRGPSLILT